MKEIVDIITTAKYKFECVAKFKKNCCKAQYLFVSRNEELLELLDLDAGCVYFKLRARELQQYSYNLYKANCKGPAYCDRGWEFLDEVPDHIPSASLMEDDEVMGNDENNGLDDDDHNITITEVIGEELSELFTTSPTVPDGTELTLVGFGFGFYESPDPTN